ncbi:proto-oncogene tyrosine-protein kinase ros, partial [Lasius niger]
MICLIPKRIDYYVKEVTITANSIVVSLPEPVPNSGCEKNNLAPTKYTISVSHCLNNNINEFNEQTYELQHEIQNLTPFTKYTLKLALSNFHIEKLWMGLQFGADVILKTTPGKLNAPENMTVQILTPTLAKIYWMPPKKLNCVAVNYEVHWISVLVSNGTGNITYQMTHDKQLINNLEQTVDGKVFTKIQLLPGQEYLIYVRVYPANFSEFFTDSLNKSIYMYSEPNNLTLSGLNWEPAQAHDSQVTFYRLEGSVENNYKDDKQIDKNKHWKLYYNGIDNYWVITGDMKQKYRFRVKAENVYGFGEWSESSAVVDLTESIEISAMQYYLPLILCFVVALVVYVSYFYCSYQQRKATNKQELATLYGIPYGNIQRNALYASGLQNKPGEFALTIIKKANYPIKVSRKWCIRK